MPLDEFERTIVDEVSRRATRMETDLEELVAIPTGHGNHEGLERARSWMSDRLVALGAIVERLPGGEKPDWLREPVVESEDSGEILCARALDRSDRGIRILLSGHLDTVHDPKGEFQLLSPRRDGIRTGPGAADMKGGLVVALTALEVLHLRGVKARWSFILNADEESGSFRSTEALQSIAREHDVGLVVEPAAGEGNIVTARFGSAQFRIDAYGRSAHAGRDAAKGISAVAALCHAMTQALAISDPSVGRTVNIGPIEGGEATNIVPDYAAAWGNARYSNDEQRDLIERAFAQIPLGSPKDLPRVTMRVLHNRPKKDATPEVLAMAKIAIEVARDMSIAVGSTSTGGVSDSNVLQAAGLPCLDGLGVRGGNLHRSDEFVVVASLAERATMLALIIHRLAESPSVP